jgi:hypothetical protein
MLLSFASLDRIALKKRLDEMGMLDGVPSHPRRVGHQVAEKL